VKVEELFYLHQNKKKTMKRLLLAAMILLATGFNSKAQIEGGTMMAGGSLYFNRYADNEFDIESTTFNVSPQFGLAFADNFIAGAWFSFSTFSDVSSWAVAPFVRYYMKNFFLQAQYGYSRSGDIGSSMFGTDLGYAMFLTDNVALEPAFYYNQYFNDGLNGYDLGFKVGFQIYFNR
jgi:hypothetical protein